MTLTLTPVSGAHGVAPAGPLTAALPRAQAATADFGTRIETALTALAESQSTARTSAAAWETGMRNDLAAVMIDQQVASLGFQLALNVRNRAISAYRDIMNMPL